MSGRRVLVAVAVFLAVTLAAAFFAPSLVGAERLRGPIASLAGRALGGAVVRIAGPVRLVLLPAPEVDAEGVTVVTPGGASLAARALSLRLALLPLLAGRLQAEALLLSGADWRLPWPAALHPAALLPPPWLGHMAARIEDGRITIGRLAIGGVTALVSADPLTGTLVAAGQGWIGRQRWRFGLHLSRPGADGAAALDATLAGAGRLAGTDARISGRLAADGTLAGTIAGNGADLGALVAAPHEAWSGRGRLSVADGLALADRLVLRLGAEPASGAIALRLGPNPRLDLALRAGRIDLPAWAAVLAHGGGPRLLPTGIDLSAEAARLGAGDLRGLRAGLDLTDHGFILRDASADLPGGATLQLRGAAQAGGFAGAVRLDGGDIPATWRWAAPLAGLPAALLATLPAPRNAQLSARIAVSPGRVALDAITGEAGGTKLSGRLLLRLGARPAVDARLAVGTLDLAGLDAAGIAGVPGLDLGLRLRAAVVTLDGFRAEEVTLAASTGADGIALRRLALRLEGAAVSASGRLGADGTLAGQVDLATDHAGRLATLWPAFWPLHGPAQASLRLAGQTAALLATLHLAAGAVRVDASPTIDLAARSAAGPVAVAAPDVSALGLADAAWLGAGPLSLRATVTVRPGHLAASGIDLAAGALRAGGTLAIDATDAGPRLSGAIDAAALPLPWPRLRDTRPATLPALLAEHPGCSGNLRLAADRVLDGKATVLRRMRGRLALDRGTLRLDDLDAELDGGTLTGRLALDAAQTPPVLSATLSLAGARIAAPVLDLPLDLTAGRADAAASVTARGYSPAALLATLAGRITAHVTGGTATGFDLPALRRAVAGDPAHLREDAARALAGGASPFATLALAGTLARGSLDMDEGALVAPDGTASLSGTASLADGALDLHVALHPDGTGAKAEGGPTAGLLLSGPLAAPVRVPQLAGLAAWLAARR